jgi:hypothetical protein
MKASILLALLAGLCAAPCSAQSAGDPEHPSEPERGASGPAEGSAPVAAEASLAESELGRSPQAPPRLYTEKAPQAAALNALVDPALRVTFKADPAAPMSERFLIYMQGSRSRFGVIPYMGDPSESEPVALTELKLLGDDVLAAVSPRGTRYFNLRAKRLPLEPMGEASPGGFYLAWAAESAGAPKDGPAPRGLLPALAHALRASGRPAWRAAVLEQSERLLKAEGWPAPGERLQSARFLGDGDIVSLVLNEDGAGSGTKRFQLERGGAMPR